MSTLVPKRSPSSWRISGDRLLVAERAAQYRGYRVPSARLPGVDHGHGVFFVTIVTGGRMPWFGRVCGGECRRRADAWWPTNGGRPRRFGLA